MTELFRIPGASPGRRRTVSARAWITRRVKGGVFQSRVSLGDGLTHTLSTHTRLREAALEFNRCHLASRLAGSTKHEA